LQTREHGRLQRVPQAFGIALGLPFALFAMFPKWIQSIPKSGGWLKDVKVVLGFIEVALAIKFFANA
jgi:thiol:disulfide interchange protein DsbD